MKPATYWPFITDKAAIAKKTQNKRGIHDKEIEKHETKEEATQRTVEI